MKYSLLLLSCFLWGCSTQNTPDAAETIRAAMQTQEEAWNRGDLDAFMLPYLQSDTLAFIGSKGLTFGWQHVLNNYKTAYPTTEQMGVLRFENKLLRPLGNHHFWVAGAWHLYRQSDTLTGHYTLVWAYVNGSWVIISDHSS